MATDFTGRRAVNVTISEVTSVPRSKLVEERNLTGLNYGSLFWPRNYFLNEKKGVAQDATDKYDVHYDGVKADADISKQEIANAQERYLLWRDRADKAQGSDRDKRLSAGDERVAYTDHVANGAPHAASGTGPGGQHKQRNGGPGRLGGPSLNVRQFYGELRVLTFKGVSR